VIKDRICQWFATCSYVGYLPLAPGTWGTLLACITVFFLSWSSNPFIVLILIAAAIVTAERARGSENDPRRIVIDEFAGLLIAVIGHGNAVWELVKAFILFRAFDILKPYPIRKLERLPGAYGIVADDVLAGIYANATLFLWGVLWR
jgi:phosphatidylglycerophosphatase A